MGVVSATYVYTVGVLEDDGVGIVWVVARPSPRFPATRRGEVLPVRLLLGQALYGRATG